jgi:putative transcriptional regulator
VGAKPTAFADRLKAARERAGLTQAALAEAAGMPVATVYQIEQGRRVKVWLETARKLAAALGVTLDQLANG